MESEKEMLARWERESAERHARYVEAGRRAAAARWAKAGERGRAVQVRLYAEDAEILKRMVYWRGRGLCVAETVRQLLRGGEGVLWERGGPTPIFPQGRPMPLPAFWRKDGGASHE